MTDQSTTILFKERETDFVYEAQMFDDHILVRPASPDFGGELENLSYMEFTDRFDEFWGHPDQYMAITVSVMRH